MRKQLHSPTATPPEREADHSVDADRVESDSGEDFGGDDQTSSKQVTRGWLGSRVASLRNWLNERRFIAMLISLIIHTVVLLVLALSSYSLRLGLEGQSAVSLEIVGERESSVTEFRIESPEAFDPAPPQTLPPTELSASQSTTEVNSTEIAAVLDHAQQPTPRVSSSQSLQSMHELNQQNLSAAFSSTGIDGRKSGVRKQTALKNGGSLTSEKAVEAALVWLAAHQMPSGAWSLLHDRGECNGRCANPGSPDRFEPAATGLSLLAFLGAGYTHLDGPYRDQVKRGIYYLRQIGESTPQGLSFLYQSERGMYNQGIATFALCEAYQLTGDPDLKRLSQEAVNFISTAQSYHGGWGYLPKQPGDLTITGWQMMALKSASAAGLEVSPATLMRARSFLGTQRDKDGINYFYRQPADKSPTCTAIGILLRLFLGDSFTDPAIIEGLTNIAKHNDYGTDIYFRYYTTLALFHVGGGLWEQWNAANRDYLVATQAIEGHEAGSWYFENQYGKEGGRLYTTAMAAMTLEVYYRYSPLYQQTDQPFEL